jgi:hypothetical protein
MKIGVFGQQQWYQVGMPLEDDTEKIMGFAFMP